MKAPGVASQTAIGSDDAMAGDKQRQRIPAAGLPDCPRGSGAADGVGHFEIGARFPERDLAENVPDLALEKGAGPNIQG
jgi:hypothetical protein